MTGGATDGVGMCLLGHAHASLQGKDCTPRPITLESIFGGRTTTSPHVYKAL